MLESEETYTYRAGEKVQLEKAPDQFMVRALPETLEAWELTMRNGFHRTLPV